ncbi:MAG: hypothetical protein NC078_11900 [Ruminococcus sp.]|nr:hypothetical protein [Ruminococcus sp.]
MNKKICAVVLAAAMMIPGTAVNANAEMISYEGNLLYGTKSAPFGKQGSSTLTSVTKDFYDQQFKFCKEIAEGKRTSTEIELTLPKNKSLSTDKLMDCWSDATNALSLEYPEYTYWLEGSQIEASYYDKSKVESATAEMLASSDYKGSKGKTVDSKKIAYAAACFKNADKTAAKYDGKSDYEKIKGYCDEICARVTYDRSAAASMVGGDPWQIPAVFDGDKSTNVVCEGYAKAFYYLCKKGGVECFIITGTMDGGDHMWNIVVLDGKSYIVDLTNTDGFRDDMEVDMKDPYRYILKGAADSGESGCTVKAPEKKVTWKEGNTTYTYTAEAMSVKYRYDNMSKALYSKSLLTVSKSDYVSHTHTGAGEYKVNSSYHWKICKDCGGIAAFGSHKFGSDGKCEKCGAKKK